MARTFLLSLALIVAVPRLAPAQFTTFIPPRRPPEKVDTGKRVAVAKKKAPAPSEAAPRIRLTNMRVWVDSAVGIRSTPRPPTRRDTADASHDYLSSRDELTSVRRFNVAAADSCHSRFASLPKSISPSVRASRSWRSRAPCSRRVCRFRRIARLPSEWSPRSNDRERSPAITAVVRGTPTVGLEPEELERFLRRDGVRKVSARDLPFAMATKADGATTVAATLAIASRAGIEVFATGGIGGVHRDAPFDESADLAELARTPMIVVCAGAKSILDLPATWERLETLGIPVVGYRTDQLPGFFSAETGIALDARVEQASEIAEIYRAHRALGRQQSLLVVQAPPAAFALDRWRVETAVRDAQAEATANDVHGARVTPFLLAAVTRLTGGSSLDANLALLEQNAGLAAEVATVCCGERKRTDR